MVHKLDRLVLQPAFSAKCELPFVLTQENAYQRGSYLKPTERTPVTLIQC